MKNGSDCVVIKIKRFCVLFQSYHCQLLKSLIFTCASQGNDITNQKCGERALRDFLTVSTSFEKRPDFQTCIKIRDTDIFRQCSECSVVEKGETLVELKLWKRRTVITFMFFTFRFSYCKLRITQYQAFLTFVIVQNSTPERALHQCSASKDSYPIENQS